MSLTTRNQPPVDHVHLILYEPKSPKTRRTNNFFLEIPLSFIKDHFCDSAHLKFLAYLGWCILGAHGSLLDGQDQVIPLGGALGGGATYYYKLHGTDDVFLYAIDLEAIKLRSSYNSASSHVSDKSFLDALTQRDRRCIFTCTPGQGAHVIPHSKGDEWLQLIVANRPNDEQVDNMDSIDDVRNGMICNGAVHSLLEHRTAVVLKTPNAILNQDDVVPRCQRSMPIHPHVSYPSDSRYTFQLFESTDEDFDRLFMPDNNDGVFLTASTLPRPSGLLLNYNYGAAAVKRWGKNNDILTSRLRIPRPKPKEVVLSPTRTSGASKRERLQKKRRLDETDRQDEAGPSGTAGLDDSDVQLDEDDAEQEWDEDDIMLFFWRNSKAARERHERKERERNDSIEEWKSSVPVP